MADEVKQSFPQSELKGKKMTEKKEDKNTKKLEDDKLEKVSGGDLFSSFYEEEYRAAGLDFEWGWLWNGTYTLRTSGEELSWNQAENAVVFFRYKHRIANNLAEINEFMVEYYDKNLDNTMSNYEG